MKERYSNILTEIEALKIERNNLKDLNEKYSLEIRSSSEGMRAFKNKLNQNFESETEKLIKHHDESFEKLQYELFQKMAEKDLEIKKLKLSAQKKTTIETKIASVLTTSSQDSHDILNSSFSAENVSINESGPVRPASLLLANVMPSLDAKVVAQSLASNSENLITSETNFVNSKFQCSTKLSLEQISNDYFLKHKVIRKFI
jgi:hypothetical protein